jgi:hypothetical protein
MLLEARRSRVAPDAPSRLNCVFNHEDLTAAHWYRGPFEHLYEVSIETTPFRADMMWITWIRESLGSGDHERAVRQADLYWSRAATSDHKSDATVHWELLTAEPVIVMNVVVRP